MTTQRAERSPNGPTRASSYGGTWSSPDVSMATETVVRLARTYPRTAVALACAGGFILGGGITPRLLASISVMAARRTIQRMLSDILEDVFSLKGGES